MTSLALISIDLVAISILTFGIYFRRHHRRDLVVAFLGVNVGVVAVAAVLGSAEIGMGVGLGLFGVLSIIRLRSSEISQREVAYYFAALALGLVAGLPSTSLVTPSALIALIVAVMWIADHPALLPQSRQQTITLDRAFSDENELRQHLEFMLNAEVTALHVERLNLVNDSTMVDVRYRVAKNVKANV